MSDPITITTDDRGTPTGVRWRRSELRVVGEPTRFDHAALTHPLPIDGWDIPVEGVLGRLLLSVRHDHRTGDWSLILVR